MSQALIGTDVDLALDVLSYLSTQVTFNAEVLLYSPPNVENLFLGQISHLPTLVDLGQLTDHLGAGLTYAVDVRERDHHPLIPGKVNASYASHVCLVLCINPASACAAGCRCKSPIRDRGAE